MNTTLKMLLIANVISTLCAGAQVGQPIFLDSTFRLSPRIISTNRAGLSINSAVLQPDGKIVIGGLFTDELGGRNGIARLNSDGSLDLTFDPGDGVTGGSSGSYVHSLALLPNGQIIVAGHFEKIHGTKRAHIARLNSDGSIDPAFAPQVTDPNMPAPEIIKVLLQPDSKVLLFGLLDGTNYELARLNSDGARDINFNPETAAIIGWIRDIALLSDNRILVAGSLGAGKLLRLDENGAWDQTYRAATVLKNSELGTDVGPLAAISIQNDGKILVGGDFDRALDLRIPQIARFNADGTLDTTFKPESDSLSSVTFIKSLPGGDIFVSGPDLLQLDTNGVGIADLPLSSFQGVISGVIPLPDGNYIVFGAFGNLGEYPVQSMARLFGSGDEKGLVEFTVPEARVMETDGTALLTVRRLGDINTSCKIDFATRDGTAVAGEDYVATHGTLIFAPGETNKSLVIQILNDGLIENDETFAVTLSNPDTGWVSGFWSECAISVESNDRGIEFSSPGFAVAENVSFVQITLGRSGESLPETDVVFSTSAGTARSGRDYSPVIGTLHFNAGQTNTSFLVPILDNGLVDSNRTFEVFLGGSAKILGQQTNATVYIVDNELAGSGQPGLAFAATSFVTSEAVGAATIVLKRFGSTESPASVDYSTIPVTAVADIDYRSGTGIVFFAPLETEKPFQIPLLKDPVSESDKSFVVVLSNPQNTTILTNHATVTILDDDRPGSIDGSFAPPPIGESAFENGRLAVAWQPDGKILVGGHGRFGEGGWNGGMMRLNNDGSKDESFEIIVETPDCWCNEAGIQRIIPQNDGKIFVSGIFNTVNGVSRTSLARLNSNGSVDLSFEPHITAENSFGAKVRTIALDNTGRVLLGGYRLSIDGQPWSGIARLNPDGSLDSTFSPGTILRTSDAEDSITGIDALLILRDGKILVAGTFNLVSGIEHHNLVRLNPDGSLDSTFDFGSGFGEDYNLGFGDPSGALRFMHEQDDGRILIAGPFGEVQGVPRSGLARLLPDGSLDRSFFSDQRTRFPISTIAVAPDDSIFAAGWHSVAKLTANGLLDSSFDAGSGTAIAGDCCENSVLYAISLQPDGKLLVAGRFDYFNGLARPGLVRLNTGNTAPRLQLAAQNAGSMNITATSSPNSAITLQASENLTNWISIQTNLPAGFFSAFLDSSVQASTHRFYRARY